MKKWDLRRTIRYYLIRLKRLQGSPHSLALGAAIGIGIGVTPTLPLHTVAIILLTIIFRANAIAALIAAAIISNPLTVVPQYFLAWKIGDLIFPNRLSWERIQEVLNQLMEQGIVDSLQTLSHLSKDALLVMLTGGIALGLPLGIATYCFAYKFFLRIKLKRLQKHRLD